MLKKISWRGIAVIVMVIALPAVMWFALFGLEVGMANDIGIQYPVMPESDFSAVPQQVIDSAVEMAQDIVSNSKSALQDIVDQLLAAYVEARDNDVMVVFNSGGWGWNISQTTGWGSILEGIKSQLEDEGYRTTVVTYRRTGSGIFGVIREFIEAATRYPHKANDLATRIRFLTDNLPDLKVIIAGESTGTVISDKTMALLKDDSRVYSIQTGTPFWHKTAEHDRTLLVNDNGATPDSFSYGDIPTMIWSTVKSWFGGSSSQDKPGNILFWLKAPGHDYSWQYPGVYNNIVEFLNKNFGKDN